jgi:hypothetical protein
MICFAVVALLVQLGGEHRDVAALAVQLDPGVLLRAGCLVVGREQGLLDGFDEDVEGDLLLALQHPEDAQVDVHQRSFDPGRLNSICTRARAMSA